MAELLEKEMTTYEQQRELFLQKQKGKYVLIHEDKVLGFFDTEKDAIDTGFDRLGYVPFLVKRIEAVDVPLSFVSAALVI